MEQVEGAAEDLRAELAGAARRIWETYFPLPESEDLAFHLGVLAIALERWEEGLGYFGYSASVYGHDPATDFNMALCHHGLGKEEAALERLDRALEADPEMKLALALREELLAGIASTVGRVGSPALT